LAIWSSAAGGDNPSDQGGNDGNGSGEDSGFGDDDYNDDDEFIDSDSEGEESDEEETMQIIVKLPPGNTITLDVQPSNTIANLKGNLCARTSIPVKQQRLIFKKDELEDGTLNYNNIFDGASLQLALRVSGGAPKTKQKGGSGAENKRKLKLMVSKATTELHMKIDPRMQLCKTMAADMRRMMEEPADFVVKRVQGLNNQELTDLETFMDRLPEIKEGSLFAKELSKWFIPSLARAETFEKELRECVSSFNQVWLHKFSECFMDDGGRLHPQKFKEVVLEHRELINKGVASETAEERKQREFQQAVQQSVAMTMQQLMQNPQVMQQVAQNPALIQQLVAGQQMPPNQDPQMNQNQAQAGGQDDEMGVEI